MRTLLAEASDPLPTSFTRPVGLDNGRHSREGGGTNLKRQRSTTSEDAEALNIDNLTATRTGELRPSREGEHDALGRRRSGVLRSG